MAFKISDDRVMALFKPGIDSVIDQEINAVVVKAQHELEMRIRNSLAGIALQIAKHMSVETMRDMITIRIDTRDLNLKDT